MTDTMAIESVVGNSAAGISSIIVFTSAFIANNRLEGKKVSPFVVLPLALAGSFLLYASTWSQSLMNLVSGILDTVGGIFGVDDMPNSFIFSAAVLISFVAVAADLSVDFKDNPHAIAALFVGPIAAHGAGGVIGSFADGFFGSLALAVIEATKSIGGA